jgi:hypothetical protein
MIGTTLVDLRERVETCRHHPDRIPSSLRAVGRDAGWRITSETAQEAEPGWLAGAPVGPEV